MPILPTERDPRLITVRRGGTLTDEHHRLLTAAERHLLARLRRLTQHVDHASRISPASLCRSPHAPS